MEQLRGVIEIIFVVAMVMAAIHYSCEARAIDYWIVRKENKCQFRRQKALCMSAAIGFSIIATVSIIYMMRTFP